MALSLTARPRPGPAGFKALLRRALGGRLLEHKGASGFKALLRRALGGRLLDHKGASLGGLLFKVYMLSVSI